MTPAPTSPEAGPASPFAGGSGGQHVEDLDVRALLDLALSAATSAGDFLLGARPEHLAVETKTSSVDAVTAMDRDSEALLIGALLANRPTDAILGEEGGSRAGTSRVRWVVDPLDGTVSYLYRLPTWCVSVAGQVDGVTQVAVVHAAALGDTYAAMAGQGARRLGVGEPWDSGEPMRCTDPVSLAQALVGTGFGYLEQRRRAQARVLSLVIPHIRDIRRSGSAALDLCWVAAGRLDAYYERGTQPWDHAAGALIAAEAGARVGGLGGRPVSSDLSVAAGPDLWTPLLELLTQARADED